MDLMERFSYLALGLVIGYIVGYIVRGLKDIDKNVHDIKEELDVVEDDVKHIRDEQGILRYPLIADVVLLVVVAATIFAAFASATASNKSNETADKVLNQQQSIISLQKSLRQNQMCTTQVLFDTVSAINERTTYARTQGDANIKAWESQLEFLTSLSAQPPPTNDQARAIYDAYVDKVEEYLREARKTRDQQIKNAYPTVQDLTACLSAKTEEPKETN